MKNFTSSKEKSCLAHYEFQLKLIKAAYSVFGFKLNIIFKSLNNYTKLVIKHK